ncbi:MAG: stage V sporulation protein AA [Blautia sp.]|uniref:stage V sporulation protein AA n=1 Tax=Blautia sp. TaxID=1955243 RepID=UPI00399232BE
MNDTLYLQLGQNIEVHHPHVYLQDIARLSCTNAKLLNRLRVLPVANLDPEKPGRYVMTAMDLVDLIQKKEPELTIAHIGEPDFILTYKKTGVSHQLFHIVKTAFVCLISFFGAAFSIMTFNTDADVGKLFRQIYEQITGSVSNGFTILEITYSIGLGLGVLFFFNHFSRVKITSDPSPMQVQMRIYEDQVNSTVIEDINRKQAADHQEPS